MWSWFLFGALIFGCDLEIGTGLPTLSPTNSPTTFDTVYVDVTLKITATAKASGTRKAALKQSIASSLSVAEAQLEQYVCGSSSSNGGITWSWTATFHAVSPLAAVGFTSAKDWSEDIESTLEATAFSSAVSTNIGDATVTVTNAQTSPSARLTGTPTDLPTLRPTHSPTTTTAAPTVTGNPSPTPTSVPSLSPTPLPSTTPTTVDTVNIDVVVVLSVVNKKPSSSNRAIFLSTTAGAIGTSESSLKHSQFSFSQLSSLFSIVTYEWEVHLNVVQSLALTTSSTAIEYAEFVEGILVGSSYLNSLNNGLQTTVTLSSATAVVATQVPTVSPTNTFSPTSAPTVTYLPTITVHPTTAPTYSPTNCLTPGSVAVDVVITLLSTKDSNSGTDDAFLSSVATQIDVEEANIENFNVSSSVGVSILGVSQYDWKAKFTVNRLLAGSGACTGDEYASHLETFFESAPFSAQLSSDVGGTMTVLSSKTSSSSPAPLSPTRAPTPAAASGSRKKIPAAQVSGASLAGWATLLSIASGMVLIIAASVTAAAYEKKRKLHLNQDADVELRLTGTTAAEEEEEPGGDGEEGEQQASCVGQERGEYL